MEDNSETAGATAGQDTLSEETVETVATMLKVLSDPTRIRLIEILNDRGGATVGALTPYFAVSQQRVSQQLSVLHKAGIVRRCRQGMRVRYELVDFACWWVVRQLASGLSPGSEGSLN